MGLKGLKVKGVKLLADALIAHQKLYNQETFGQHKDACGTVCCLAGFCLVEKIGRRKFNAMLKKEDIAEACVEAGRKQLGIRNKEPLLFSPVSSWPCDLRTEYHENGPRGRVVVALKALQRLRPTGTIDPNPEAVHTRLPQLKALLAKGKR